MGKTVTTWMGKDINECTRKELLDCIAFIASDLKRERSLHDLTLRIMRTAVSYGERPWSTEEAIKRAEGGMIE